MEVEAFYQDQMDINKNNSIRKDDIEMNGEKV